MGVRVGYYPFPFSLDADLTGTDSLPLFSVPAELPTFTPTAGVDIDLNLLAAAASVERHAAGRSGSRLTAGEAALNRPTPSIPKRHWHQGSQKDFKYGVRGNVRSKMDASPEPAAGRPSARRWRFSSIPDFLRRHLSSLPTWQP